ncbi:unnamed protein product [Bursaphelenchus xylophilus]|nr:unnamed protein product [Bursaphelenchus xylophilus]CAG9081175.1 unnamed protein product [Bursaphelenchus xylophilus]
MLGRLLQVLVVLFASAAIADAECEKTPKGMFKNYFRLWAADLKSSLESEPDGTTSVLIGQFIEDHKPHEAGIAISFYGAKTDVLRNMSFTIKAEANYGQRDYVRTVIFSDGFSIYKVLGKKSITVPSEDDTLDRERMYFYKHMLVVNSTHVVRPFRVIATDDYKIMNQFFEPMLSLVNNVLESEAEMERVQRCMNKSAEINPCIMDVTVKNNTIHEVVFDQVEHAIHVSAFNGYVFSLFDFEHFTIFNTTADGKCFEGKTEELFDKIEPPKGYTDPVLLTTIPLFEKDDEFFKKYAKPFDYHPQVVSSSQRSSLMGFLLAILALLMIGSSV